MSDSFIHSLIIGFVDPFLSFQFTKGKSKLHFFCMQSGLKKFQDPNGWVSIYLPIWVHFIYLFII